MKQEQMEAYLKGESVDMKKNKVIKNGNLESEKHARTSNIHKKKL